MRDSKVSSKLHENTKNIKCSPDHFNAPARGVVFHIFYCALFYGCGRRGGCFKKMFACPGNLVKYTNDNNFLEYGLYQHAITDAFATLSVV